MDRRRFLQKGVASGAALALLPTLEGSLLAMARKGHDPLKDIGIITNVVQTHIKEDHRKTLASLAGMGYRYLESGSTWGESPAQLKAFLDSIGLKPLVAGSNITGLRGDGLKKQIDSCLEMDRDYLVCYWPWIDSGMDPQLDYILKICDELNEIGSACSDAGLCFVYHNHDMEFIELEGETVYKRLLDRTEADLVKMQIDLYWAYKGGGDIREYFKAYPGRFPLVHMKDSYDSDSRESFACVGSGIIDFTDLLSYRDVAGFKHLIVEHDHPEPEQEMECAQSSLEYIKSLDY